MSINLEILIGNKKFEMEAEPGITVREIADKYQAEGPYRFLMSIINGAYKQMDYVIEEDTSLRLVDMRSRGGDIPYQRALVYLFINAVRKVLGADVRVRNALNKGIFVIVERQALVTEEELAEIDKAMREMVAEDAVIDYAEDSSVYGPEIPTAGFIEHFELVRYEEGIIIRFPYYDKPDVIPDYVDDCKLYEVFEEETRWLRLLKATYMDELNDEIRKGNARDLILLSEALHEKKIAQIADRIKHEGKRIVLIAGPSSSGKTTFAHRLCIQLRVIGLEPLYMGTDDYFVEREDTPKDENGEYNFEDLDALDIELFNNNMNDLLEGKVVDLPEFDFMEGHKVFGKRLTSIKDNQLIVIEGIHALNDELTKQIDKKAKFKIYISPLTQLNIDKHNLIHSTDVRMLRRMSRDARSRGRSAADTISGWNKVREGEKKNIFPHNSRADIMFNSVLAYELPLIKERVLPMLEEIKPEQDEYCDARQLIDFLSYFEGIDDEDMVPNNSIAREFIGGGVFVK